METKKCTHCKTEKPIDAFHKSCVGKQGRWPQCKECRVSYSRKYYEKNKQRIKKQIKKRNLRKRKELQNWLDKYLGPRACVDCGETDKRVLEFDHIDPKTKYRTAKGNSRGVSELVFYSYSLDTIKREIEKCEIRCCNCHRKKTIKDLGWSRNYI